MMTSNQTIGLFDNNGLSLENVDFLVIEFLTDVFHDQSSKEIPKCLVKDGV